MLVADDVTVAPVVGHGEVENVVSAEGRHSAEMRRHKMLDAKFSEGFRSGRHKRLPPATS